MVWVYHIVVEIVTNVVNENHSSSRLHWYFNGACLTVSIGQTEHDFRKDFAHDYRDRIRVQASLPALSESWHHSRHLCSLLDDYWHFSQISHITSARYWMQVLSFLQGVWNVEEHDGFLRLGSSRRRVYCSEWQQDHVGDNQRSPWRRSV